MEFDGKVAIVTGATSGIGMATAFRFAEQGARVAAVGRKKEILSKVQRQNIRTYSVDLTNEQETSTFARRALEDFGGVDILVNAAGIIATHDGTAHQNAADARVRDIVRRASAHRDRSLIHIRADLQPAQRTDNEAVQVAAGGKVTIAGWLRGYGKVVYVDHGNGLSTRYGHLSQINVTLGQTVTRGQVIGLVGSTGRSTGPHLHYEVRINNQPVDPKQYLPGAENQ